MPAVNEKGKKTNASSNSISPGRPPSKSTASVSPKISQDRLATHLVDRGQVVEKLQRRGRDVERCGRRALLSGGGGGGVRISRCSASAVAASCTAASSGHRF
jgi:hypothetical protein